MNIYLEEKAQDEVCEALIRKFAGIYYPYKPIDIVGFAKFLGLKLLFVTFCDDLTRLGFYSDGKTAVMVMSKNGPVSKVFPKNTILISDELRAAKLINKLRFTVGHETGHHIRTLMTGKAAEEAYLTELDHDNECSYEQMKRILSNEEKLANKAAASLLMPRKLVVNTVRSVMDDKPIKVYGEDNYDEDTKCKLKEIADFMQVSVMALTIRLKTLRLLEKHSIDEFEGFANIFGGAAE